MKTVSYIFSIVVLILFTGNLFSQETAWTADEAHTKIQFIAVHMAISEVSGQFNEYEVNVLSDEENFTDAKIDVVIKAKSIDTNNQKRDDHLRSDDFLGVEQYPEIKFSGKGLRRVDEDKYKLTGDLTIRDVTREVELDVDYRGTIEDMNPTRAGFKITGTVNRFDYNVDWNKSFTKGLVVSREIDIVCDVQLIKE